MEKQSYIGMRFGRLVVVERVDDAIAPSSGKKIIRYRCICDCGNETIVRKVHLTNHKIQSCGCLQKECLGLSRKKHGYAGKERLYKVWLDIKSRCNNPKCPNYKNYGGRGIKICDEWDSDYEIFRSWCMNNGYFEDIKNSGRNNITIDRIDNNGDYEPNNCRFITNKENCLNKRNNISNTDKFLICPICGEKFEVQQRNQQKTCSPECGWELRKLKYFFERDEYGRFKAGKELSPIICD